MVNLFHKDTEKTFENTFCDKIQYTNLHSLMHIDQYFHMDYASKSNP